MPKPIAVWNPARGVWEVPETENLICEHSDVFSETWPSSGTTRNGWAYALPTWVPRTDGSESSSLLMTPKAIDGDHSGIKTIKPGQSMHLSAQLIALMPTPTVSDGNGAGAHGTGGQDLRTTVSLLPTPTSRDGKGANQRGDATCLHGALLPTPRATDGTNGGPNQRGSSGDLMLPSAVHHLLPTPAVNDMGEGKTVEKWDEWTAAQKAKHGNGNGHGPSLAIESLRLLPTPKAYDGVNNSPAAQERNSPDLRSIEQLIGASTSPPSDAGNECSDD